jgi:oligoribonuclease
MSGLDVENCRILEVAIVVTDLEMNELATFQRIVRQPQSVLDAMGSWCQKQHGASGLTAAVPNGDVEEKVEAAVVRMINRFWTRRQLATLCGNSISTDRQFLEAYWPKVAGRLHYRMVDVSSWKVLFEQRFGLRFKKKGGHRALDDARESVDELKYYLSLLDQTKIAAEKSL